jgi:PLP dependent protein
VTAPPLPSQPVGLGHRVDEVRRRIQAVSDDPSSVRIVAVTKGFGVDAVHAALSVGLTDIGENYADELLAKAGTLGSPDGAPAPGAPVREDGEPPPPVAAPVWHYLGAVQRNKVSRLAPSVAWWQGLSRIEEGRAIARRRPGATVLVQVDVAGIPGRGGCRPDEVAELVRALRGEDLDMAGLMAVGPPGPADEVRRGFRTVSILADDLDLPVRSMGMSDDFEVAVSEGSTMVRLGRVLFGPRPPRR